MFSEYKLPPKAGYVEVEDENGERTYRPTEAQQRLNEQDELLFDLIYNQTLTDWGV